MTTHTLDKVNKLLELRKAATQGDWKTDNDGDIFVLSPEAKRVMAFREDDNVIGTSAYFSDGNPNSEFCAFSSNHITEIAQAFIEMSGELDRTKSSLHQALTYGIVYGDLANPEFQTPQPTYEEVLTENTALKSQIEQLKNNLDQAANRLFERTREIGNLKRELDGRK